MFVRATYYREKKTVHYFDIGATYGVLYYPQENMHWSDTGH
ncbi:hypothetical protein ACCD08_00280 [Telluria sp. Tellsp104]